MMETFSRVARARVTTPVPAATSRIRDTRIEPSRCLKSFAYGSNINGTRYVSYSLGMEPENILSTSVIDASGGPSQNRARYLARQESPRDLAGIREHRRLR